MLLLTQIAMLPHPHASCFIRIPFTLCLTLFLHLDRCTHTSRSSLSQAMSLLYVSMGTCIYLCHQNYCIQLKLLLWVYALHSTVGGVLAELYRVVSNSITRIQHTDDNEFSLRELSARIHSQASPVLVLPLLKPDFSSRY